MQRFARSDPRRLSAWSDTLGLALFATCALSLVLNYLAGHSFRDYLYSADVLYLPTLFSDLSHGGQLSDWSLPNAPSFFPDYILYWVAFKITHVIYMQLIAYSLLQVTLLLLSLYALAVQTGLPVRLTSAIAALTLLAWLSLSADQPFLLLLTSTLHYGTFISAILFCSLWLSFFEAGKQRTRMIATLALCTLSFLTSLSDNLFLVQVLAPFVAVNVLYATRRLLSSRLALWGIAPISFGLLGFFTHELIVRKQARAGIEVGTAIKVSFTHLTSNFGQTLALLQGIAVKTPLFDAAVLAYLVLIVVSIVSILGPPEKKIGDSKLYWLILFSFASTIATVLATLVIDGFPVAMRYLIPTSSWPLIIAVFGAARRLGTYGRYFVNILPIIACSLILINAVALIRLNGIQPDYYSATMSCIDHAIGQYGLSNGIAQYWDAKPIQMVSKLDNIILAQYSERLARDGWETSRRYFKDRYDFAIIADDKPSPFKLSTADLYALNGPPKTTVTCFNRTILIYGKNAMKVR
jgi:hypothetical protein